VVNSFAILPLAARHAGTRHCSSTFSPKIETGDRYRDVVIVMTTRRILRTAKKKALDMREWAKRCGNGASEVDARQFIR